MNATFQSLILRLALSGLLGALIGLQLGNIWLGLCAALFGATVFFLRDFQRFYTWLSSGAGPEKPLLSTFWSNVRDQVVRIVRQHENEKTQLVADVEFFKDSFQALDSAVLVVDRSGEIDWANAAAEKMLGISLQRDSGEPLQNLLRAPAFLKYFESQKFDEPMLMRSPVDRSRQLEVQATVFREEYTLIFVRDITNYAQLERVRQDFVANVSHEMRTPLTVINGYLELLMDNKKELAEDVHAVLKKMLVQSRRMDDLVNDLLWLSRLESMPQPDRSEQFSLKGMLDGIIEDARVGSPSVTIELRIANDIFRDATVTPEQIQMHGAYEELRAAISNLVQNALKYTSADGHISIECSRYFNDFYLQVKDDGVGIDPVHLPRLTERFYRVDDSRTTDTGGTGLGLAIVKHVLKRHDARLRIRSKPGKGSTFTCVFPIASLSYTPLPASHQAGQATSGLRANGDPTAAI
ncbi:MAG: phosphate regulon sensor histidine kinase PhoR [Gammaproteobacteria bacterium]|nr:phosphate regulon sensor histidine kinase PhoR [Gammaproteobacteria bacterium]MBT8151078.1 phosphate regulon sensor histidine kinase PhoR [Gammaproteobacteria bacterium]NNL10463.1 phosphate regulon sensor histidine kinase PhoR [Pseudomonadales bacterium]NNM10838.1 phosphate regulon sensor histidine kinase PhoR [Pseudomonadales bacterium]